MANNDADSAGWRRKAFGVQASRCAAFLLAFLLLLKLGDHVFGLIFDRIHEKTRSGQVGGKLNYFLALPSPPSITILGSSKAAHNVMPGVFTRSAFNLGHDGSYLLFAEGVLHVLEWKGKLSPVILLHVDRKIFVRKKSEDLELSDLRSLKVYYGKVPWMTRHIDALPITERVKYVFSAYRYNGIIIKMMDSYRESLGPVPPMDGFEPLAPSPKDEDRNRRGLAKIRAAAWDFSDVNREPLELIAHIAALCRKNRISLYCFSSPDFTGQLEQYRVVNRLLDSVLASEHIPFLDYNRHPLEPLSRLEMWKDLTHLNSEGARIFSLDLARKVDSLIALRLDSSWIHKIGKT